MNEIDNGRFEETIKPHMDYLFSFARYLTGDRTEAEDLTQKTVLRALRYFDQFENGTNIRAWMSQILKNLWIDEYRKRDRQSDRERKYAQTIGKRTADTGGKCCPEAMQKQPEVLLNQCVPDRMKYALLGLSKKYREVFIKYAIQDLTYEEIADELNCPLGTIRSRMSRARNQLEDKLTGFAEQTGYFRNYSE